MTKHKRQRKQFGRATNRRNPNQLTVNRSAGRRNTVNESTQAPSRLLLPMEDREYCTACSVKDVGKPFPCFELACSDRCRSKLCSACFAAGMAARGCRQSIQCPCCGASSASYSLKDYTINTNNQCELHESDYRISPPDKTMDPVRFHDEYRTLNRYGTLSFTSRDERGGLVSSYAELSSDGFEEAWRLAIDWYVFYVMNGCL